MEGEILLKKNQLALILLTLVLMLTVYYITDPFGNKDKDPDPTPPGETSGRFEELLELRNALREERATTVLALETIIADYAKTIAEKEAALNEKRYLNSLTEKELLMELEVIKKGYRDCFVHASAEGVVVTVVAEEHSLKAGNEILKMVAANFIDYENVQIRWRTTQEVMAKTSN